MSNAIFPTFIGLRWGVKKSPNWNTMKKKSASGRTVRASFYSAPIWQFSLQYEVLRANTAYQELQQLVGFFNSRRGAFDTFLYQDPNENSVTAQVVATTVSGQTQYRLVKNLGGFVEPIGAVNGTPIIYLDGTPVSISLYTIDENGYLNFNTAPTAGQVISWTGSFYYRVVFQKDELDFEEFMKDLWEARRVDLESVKL